MLGSAIVIRNPMVLVTAITVLNIRVSENFEGGAYEWPIFHQAAFQY